MAKLMHSSIRFVVLAFCVACFSTELVAQSSHRLKWSDDGERCLFKAKDNFYLIDVEKREKEILFENGTGIFDQVQEVTFGEGPNEFILLGVFVDKLDRTTGKKERLDRPHSDFMKSRFSLPPLHSINGGESTKIEVMNSTDEPFQMVWVDSNGNEHDYGRVRPGASFVQSTYIGHAWLLKSKACLLYTSPSPRDQRGPRMPSSA